MADEIQQTDPPEQGPSAGPSSGPGSTASNLFQDSHPPSPSMQDTISGARGSSAHISEQSPPSPVANPAKGPEDLRADYETIHDMIHSAQRLLFEQRYLQAPTGDVIVGSRHMIRQYLPPGGPEEFTLNDYRAVLSVALQSVRAVFVEKEAERKEAAKKEAVETEALKKDALEKEALEKEALGKREALEKEALMQNREEGMTARELSSGDDECKPKLLDGAPRRSKRKAVEVKEASENESSGRDGERTKRGKKS